MENQNLIQNLLGQIKQNKKYKSISDEFIIDEIKKYLKSNLSAGLISDKSAVKEIRARLHKIYSSYQTKKKRKRELYLEELKQVNPKNQKQIIDIINKILLLTLSTKERLNDYSEIYKKILGITKEPKIIVDLGCGLNPVSYFLAGLKKVNYYAYDINDEDIKFLNQYFEIIKVLGLNGKAAFLDIRNSERISYLPFSDIVFLFKIIDIIDDKNHKPSEELIKLLIKKTKFIIASFATKTLTRKRMNFPNRKWFELMLERNNLKFKTFQTENEIFYIVFS